MLSRLIYGLVGLRGYIHLNFYLKIEKKHSRFSTVFKIHQIGIELGI
ncbi:hypothetical protein CULT_2760004 [[Clostridium] ultunense Esp]|nr:hypothetical protein CULT_2760004 [[Clostridium] ultunense Esp]